MNQFPKDIGADQMQTEVTIVQMPEAFKRLPVEEQRLFTFDLTNKGIAIMVTRLSKDGIPVSTSRLDPNSQAGTQYMQAHAKQNSVMQQMAMEARADYERLKRQEVEAQQAESGDVSNDAS